MSLEFDQVDQQDYDYPDFNFTSILVESDVSKCYMIEGRAVWLHNEDISDLNTAAQTFNIERSLAIEKNLINE
tara:strand:- start:135 stop:353 length:219 start_codon:yes stop_codon:yes gene_type:complete